MAAAAILKNRKIATSWLRIGRFRPNLARRRSSALFSRPTVKSLKFDKSKMAAAAILENRNHVWLLIVDCTLLSHLKEHGILRYRGCRAARQRRRRNDVIYEHKTKNICL